MQRKRLFFLIVASFLVIGVLSLVCGVWLLVKLTGIISPHLADLEKSGLKGLVDSILNFISQIWNGTGK